MIAIVASRGHVDLGELARPFAPRAAIAACSPDARMLAASVDGRPSAARADAPIVISSDGTVGHVDGDG
jgi:hypothetical protein